MKHLKKYKIFENKSIELDIIEYFQEFIDDGNLNIVKEFNKYYLYFKINTKVEKDELDILDNLLSTSDFFNDIKVSIMRLRDSDLNLDITLSDYVSVHKVDNPKYRNCNYFIQIVDNTDNKYIKISEQNFNIKLKDSVELDKKDIVRIFNILNREEIDINFKGVHDRDLDFDLDNDLILNVNDTTSKLFVTMSILGRQFSSFIIFKLKNDKFIFTRWGEYYLVNNDELEKLLSEESNNAK